MLLDHEISFFLKSYSTQMYCVKTPWGEVAQWAELQVYRLWMEFHLYENNCSIFCISMN